MANGTPMGPVSDRTALAARGAQKMASGLGRISGAGSAPDEKRMVQAAAEQRGADAAHNIRMRYFKEEFKQIKEQRVQPMLDDLQESASMLQAKLDTRTRPVPRIMQPVEVAESMAAEGHTQEQFQSIQVGTTAEGKPKTEAVRTEQPAPNPAWQSDAAGLVQSDEVLSFTGEDGHPIAVASPEGVSWRQAAMVAHGEVNTRVMQGLMGIMGEYSGNPFASQYGSKLLNVSFDPTRAGEFAGYDFDDEGTKATKVELESEHIQSDGKLYDHLCLLF